MSGSVSMCRAIRALLISSEEEDLDSAENDHQRTIEQYHPTVPSLVQWDGTVRKSPQLFVLIEK